MMRLLGFLLVEGKDPFTQPRFSLSLIANLVWLDRIIEELSADRSMPSTNQYRIAVAARKGGVGKTTIACGLASVFAAQQKSDMSSKIYILNPTMAQS